MSSVSLLSLEAPAPVASLDSTPSSSAKSNYEVAPPSDSVHLSLAATRELLQFARVLADEKSGKLTSDQATQLNSEITLLHDQVKGGITSEQSINQTQNAISKEIYGYAHGLIESAA